MHRWYRVRPAGGVDEMREYRFQVVGEDHILVERYLRGQLEELCRVWRCRALQVVDEGRPEEPFVYAREVKRRGRTCPGQEDLPI